MRTTLDGQILFDEQELEVEIESLNRQSIESAAAGLDGVLNIDMGQRGRKIKQKGMLREQSREKLERRAGAIRVFLDGREHSLRVNDGRSFERLVIDVFEVKEPRESGAGVAAEYKIEYRQMKV